MCVRERERQIDRERERKIFFSLHIYTQRESEITHTGCNPISHTSDTADCSCIILFERDLILPWPEIKGRGIDLFGCD